MGMNLAQGGHLTHGREINFSGQLYNFVPYSVDRETRAHRLRRDGAAGAEHKPKIIVAGATAYPRIIDFARAREIADEVGAYLMADMAHIAGLVAGGVHPSPVPYSHVVTSTTHKTLRGPRGGFILSNEEIAQQIDKTVFPGVQGGPHMHIIAAKAVCFGEALRPEFKHYAATDRRQRQGARRGAESGRLPPRLRRHGQPPDAGRRRRQGDQRPQGGAALRQGGASRSTATRSPTTSARPSRAAASASARRR